MTPYYQDDAVMIYHGDCREILPFLELPRSTVVLTDPPYGIGVTKMRLGDRRIPLYRGEAAWDQAAPDLGFLLELELPMVVWGGNFFSLPVSRGWFVWDKQNDGTDYADCEMAWTNRDAVVKRFVWRWSGGSAKEWHERDRVHPTQKPVPLMRWCLGFFPGATLVLDPFMGGGSTLIAAKHLGLKAIGIEIEERFCEAAARRLSQEVLAV